MLQCALLHLLLQLLASIITSVCLLFALSPSPPHANAGGQLENKPPGEAMDLFSRLVHAMLAVSCAATLLCWRPLRS